MHSSGVCAIVAPMRLGLVGLSWAMVLGLSVASGGCREGQKASGTTGTASSREPVLKVADNDQQPVISEGDRVVVESGEATFWAGKVTKVDEAEITYEYGSNKSSSKAPKEKVYVVVANHKTNAKAGDHAICQTGATSWNPCLIKAINNGVYVATDQWGKDHNLGASEILLPNAGTKKNIGDTLAEAAKHRGFIEAAKGSGAPMRPEGWIPRPGDDVVAMFTASSWYGGRIRRVTPTKVQIAWDDKTTPSERNHDEVAPKPSDKQEISPGQFVLARPAKGTLWDFHRVETVEDESVVVVDKDGNKRTVKTSDLIPLGK